MPDFADLLRSMHDSDDDEPAPKISREGEIECLKDGLRALLTRHEFSAGMIVRQKPACRIYKDLADNGLAIVVEVLREPIITGQEQSPASDEFRWPVNMITGEWSSSRGVFILHHVDSRRYEPVEP